MSIFENEIVDRVLQTDSADLLDPTANALEELLDDPIGLQFAMQFAADVALGEYEKRPGEHHVRNQTIGSSVDIGTKKVFDDLVLYLSENRSASQVVAHLVERFILLARPLLAVQTTQEAERSTAHEDRSQLDKRYREIFEWEPRFAPSGEDAS